MLWFLLALSAINIWIGIQGIRWHRELDKKFENGNPYDINLADYIISAFAYPLTPVAIGATIVSAYLLIKS